MRVGRLGVLDVALQQLALGCRDVGAGSPLGASLGQVLLHRRPRTLERAVECRHARLENVRGLLGGAVEHVSQDQDRTLQGNQASDGDQIGKLDRLLGDHRRLGTLVVARQPVEQLVGTRQEEVMNRAVTSDMSPGAHRSRQANGKDSSSSTTE
jgi:hypothetical protein